MHQAEEVLPWQTLMWMVLVGEREKDTFLPASWWQGRITHVMWLSSNKERRWRIYSSHLLAWLAGRGWLHHNLGWSRCLWPGIVHCQLRCERDYPCDREQWKTLWYPWNGLRVVHLMGSWMWEIRLCQLYHISEPYLYCWSNASILPPSKQVLTRIVIATHRRMIERLIVEDFVKGILCHIMCIDLTQWK